MFIPNTPCTIRTKTTDKYGSTVPAEPVDALCGVVRLEYQLQPTSVRADSSASRGNAEEHIAMSRLLFPTDTDIKTGDLVSVMNYLLKVESVNPRNDVQGNLDHLQVDLVRSVY